MCLHTTVLTTKCLLQRQSYYIICNVIQSFSFFYFDGKQYFKIVITKKHKSMIKQNFYEWL